MTTTSNMGLILPEPGVTAGPAWATELNAALSTLDVHDHSSGKGAKVTPAGFSFASDLPCRGFKLTDCGGVALRSLTGNLTTAGSLHVKGGDLYHVSSNGTAVQITSGTGLNLASTGTIGGDYGGVGITAAASYSNTLKTFSWLQDSGIAAKMFMGDILLTHPSASQNSVTLKAQSGSAAYDVAFPLAAPVSNDSLMFANTSGVGLFKTLVGTTNQITVTSGAGTMTFALPQVIHTAATPTFAGMTLTGALGGTTASFSGAVGVTGALTAGSIVTAGTVDGVDVSAFKTDYDAKVNQDVKTTASPTFVGATVSGLTASYAVVTDGSKALASVEYTSSANANTLVARSPSAGASFATVVATTVNASAGIIAGPSAPTMMIKKFSGTFDAAGDLTVAHGLTGARIKCIDGKGFLSGTNRWISLNAFYAGVGAACNIQWDDTNIFVFSDAVAMYNQAYVLYVTYEAT